MSKIKTKPFLYDDASANEFSKRVVFILRSLIRDITKVVKKEYGLALDSKEEDKKKDIGLIEKITAVKISFDKKNKKRLTKLSTAHINSLNIFSQSAFYREIENLEKEAKKQDRLFDAKKMRDRLGIGLAIDEKIDVVANRITSLSDIVVDRIGKEIKSFKRFGDVNRLLRIVQASGEVGLNRARFIAEQTTRATLSEFNTLRATNTGAKQFEWLHSASGLNPRPLHVSYDNRIFSFDKPPPLGDGGGNGMPGQLPNCRCFFATVYDLEDLS